MFWCQNSFSWGGGGVHCGKQQYFELFDCLALPLCSSQICSFSLLQGLGMYVIVCFVLYQFNAWTPLANLLGKATRVLMLPQRHSFQHQALCLSSVYCRREGRCPRDSDEEGQRLYGTSVNTNQNSMRAPNDLDFILTSHFGSRFFKLYNATKHNYM